MTTVFTIMSYGGMALAVICLVIAVILFIKWNIPKVFGDITGRTERKAIERIQQEGYEVNAPQKAFLKSSGASGKIKVRKMNSGRLDSSTGSEMNHTDSPLEERDTSRESAVTKEEKMTTAVLHVHDASEETTVLEQESAEPETVVLSGTSVEEETTVLNKASATTILAENSVDGVINIPDECITQPGQVEKVLDFIITHTEAVIPHELH
ncbi:MAG: hypothetical protein K2N24_02140 [Lachnospiraceae bacterium]|nr:hypothetical protein [Lachnospiraceae bacterium]